MAHCSCFWNKKNNKLKKEHDEEEGPRIISPNPAGVAPAQESAIVQIQENQIQEANVQLRPRVFSYGELANATHNFREEDRIGEGGFGPVFKGFIERTGQTVAVKKLNLLGCQGEKEFLVEVLMLNLLRHQNLVTLIGYCTKGDDRLLVYEYLCNGSLEYHLHDLAPGMEPLDWSTRVMIALGAAKGLNYLHNEAQPSVIYRDMKSSNILLDENFQPKLSDFGLAKFGPPEDESHVSTRVMGTFGYCAPEYAGTGRLTMKSDIYSFGIVLLEILTGKKPMDNTRNRHEHLLLDWARPYLQERRYVQLADPKLKGQFSERSLIKLVEVIFKCLREDHRNRPDASEIIVALDHVAAICASSSSAAMEGEERGRIRSISERGEGSSVNKERAKAVAEARLWGESSRDKRKGACQ